MRTRHEVSRGPAQEAWLPQRDTTVLLISAAADLQGAVGRVCAAAAVELVIAEDLEQVGGQWEDVAAVLLDAVVAAPDGGLAGWDGATIVVGFSRDSALLWQRAERQGADRVAVLPDSAPWLANYLGRLRNSVAGAGVVGILAASGGAGASTLAVLVASAAAARGTRTLLVDGDPWGGGLASALSAQHLPGLGWAELLQASGTINPDQLASSLPQLGSLALLSWNRSPLREEGMRAQAAAAEVMRAARAAYGLVVVDLARAPETMLPLARHCNGAVFVMPASARAAAVTVALRPLLPPMPIGAVVRGRVSEGLDAAMVADAVGLPLMGQFPHLRGVAQALESQRLAELLRRRAVRTLVANLLGWLGGDSSRSHHAVKGRRA